MLLEPYLFDQEPVCFCTEGFEFLIGAVCQDPQGFGEIQTEHFHEVMSVDFVAGIPDLDREGTGGGHGYKVLHIPYTLKSNRKFLHNVPPDCTNWIFSCIIGENDQNRLLSSLFEKMLFIIAFFCENATVGLSESYKLWKLLLVELTK